MSFCAVINCMDGRTQVPAIKYLTERFNTRYVDSITEAGPILYLAEKQNCPETISIIRKIDISIKKHKSKAIAIVAHYDCTGNPLPKQAQLKQLCSAVLFVKEKYPQTEVIGLWVDENFSVEEIKY